MGLASAIAKFLKDFNGPSAISRRFGRGSSRDDARRR